jgi:hypothetical protein
MRARAIKILFLVMAAALRSIAQDVPELDNTAKTERISLLTYARVISSAKGAYRFDQNLVPTFRLNDWLRLEAGLRFGERPGHFSSYYHYKFELRTKQFWNTLRVLARISDNVISYPEPAYRKTNELVAAEAKWPVSGAWELFAGSGYVFSAQQNNNTEAVPTRHGEHRDYPIFKISARYLLRKGFLETTYGSYDTFNPYELDKPFFQEMLEYDILGHTALYSYFRYQYNGDVRTPENYFLGVGVRLLLMHS